MWKSAMRSESLSWRPAVLLDEGFMLKVPDVEAGDVLIYHQAQDAHAVPTATTQEAGWSQTTRYLARKQRSDDCPHPGTADRSFEIAADLTTVYSEVMDKRLVYYYRMFVIASWPRSTPPCISNRFTPAESGSIISRKSDRSSWQCPCAALRRRRLGKRVCITFAEECALSLCTRRFDTSVVNGTTRTAITNEDFGCLSQLHSVEYNGALLSENLTTHCWQSGEPCADLRFTNLPTEDPTKVHLATDDPTEFKFCSDGIVVQNSTDMYSFATPPVERLNVQNRLLERLTGNRTAILTNEGSFHEEITTASTFAMDYVAANGLGPVLTGVAASLTQQALFANTSEQVVGTVWTTVTYVAVDWPWLLYPAILVFGAIVLLALTATHSHRCGLKTWKSSMLPLLYRSLASELLARQRVLHDVSTMTGIASRAKVTLVETSRDDRVVLTQ